MRIRLQSFAVLLIITVTAQCKRHRQIGDSETSAWSESHGHRQKRQPSGFGMTIATGIGLLFRAAELFKSNEIPMYLQEINPQLDALRGTLNAINRRFKLREFEEHMEETGVLEALFDDMRHEPKSEAKKLAYKTACEKSNPDNSLNYLASLDTPKPDGSPTLAQLFNPEKQSKAEANRIATHYYKRAINSAVLTIGCMAANDKREKEMKPIAASMGEKILRVNETFAKRLAVSAIRDGHFADAEAYLFWVRDAQMENALKSVVKETLQGDFNGEHVDSAIRFLARKRLVEKLDAICSCTWMGALDTILDELAARGEGQSPKLFKLAFLLSQVPTMKEALKNPTVSMQQLMQRVYPSWVTAFVSARCENADREANCYSIRLEAQKDGKIRAEIDRSINSESQRWMPEVVDDGDYFKLRSWNDGCVLCGSHEETLQTTCSGVCKQSPQAGFWKVTPEKEGPSFWLENRLKEPCEKEVAEATFWKTSAISMMAVLGVAVVTLVAGFVYDTVCAVRKSKERDQSEIAAV